jgi:hypothetical protein
MSYDENNTTSVPARKIRPHYHGDEVKTIFVMSALILILAQSTRADIPLSTFGAVTVAALLVIVAGIINPKQVWIHWVSEVLAVLGTIVFGTAAVDRYRGGTSAFEPSFLYIETLAVLSLFALYFATRTIRGILLKRHED